MHHEISVAKMMCFIFKVVSILNITVMLWLIDYANIWISYAVLKHTFMKLSNYWGTYIYWCKTSCLSSTLSTWGTKQRFRDFRFEAVRLVEVRCKYINGDYMTTWYHVLIGWEKIGPPATRRPLPFSCT